ncbi:hypothetical protein GQ53DRAFT_129232 [Thozetella sp. PMI_491]|nr:hypothetical protein GQ53DRAFT_129232 [Thozetella sp. PMI_491]
MDPVSAIGVASAALTFLQVLAGGINNIKTMMRDASSLKENFKDLFGELDALHDVLEAMTDEVENRSPLSDVPSWWSQHRLSTLLQNATRTTTRLGLILQDLKRQRNPFPRLWQYYRAQGYDREVNTLRARMSLYIVSLQVPVFISRYNVLAAQSRSLGSRQEEATSQLTTQLSHVQMCIARVQEDNQAILLRIDMLARSSVRSSVASWRSQPLKVDHCAGADVHDEEEDNNEGASDAGISIMRDRETSEDSQELIEVVESLSRSATTVSTRGSSTRSLSTNRSRAIRSGDGRSGRSSASAHGLHQQSLAQGSDTSVVHANVSVQGVPLSSIRRETIANWAGEVLPSVDEANEVAAMSRSSIPPSELLESLNTQDQRRFLIDRRDSSMPSLSSTVSTLTPQDSLSLLSPSTTPRWEQQLVEQQTPAPAEVDIVASEADTADSDTVIAAQVGNDRLEHALGLVRQGKFQQAIVHMKTLMRDINVASDWTDTVVDSLVHAYVQTDPIGPDATAMAEQYAQINNRLAMAVYTEGKRRVGLMSDVGVTNWLQWAFHAFGRWYAANSGLDERTTRCYDDCKVQYALVLLSKDPTSTEAESILKGVQDRPSVQRDVRLLAMQALAGLDFARGSTEQLAAVQTSERMVWILYKEFGLVSRVTQMAIVRLVNTCFELRDARGDQWAQRIDIDLPGLDRCTRFRVALLQLQHLHDLDNAEEAGDHLSKFLTRYYKYDLGWTEFPSCADCIAANSAVVLEGHSSTLVQCDKTSGRAKEILTHKDARTVVNTTSQTKGPPSSTTLSTSTTFSALHFLAGASPRAAPRASCAPELLDISTLLKRREVAMPTWDCWFSYATNGISGSVRPLTLAVLYGKAKLVDIFLAPLQHQQHNWLLARYKSEIDLLLLGMIWGAHGSRKPSPKQTECLRRVINLLPSDWQRNLVCHQRILLYPSILYMLLQSQASRGESLSWVSGLLINTLSPSRASLVRYPRLNITDSAARDWLETTYDTAKVLLDHGANANERSSDGHSALYTANSWRSFWRQGPYTFHDRPKMAKSISDQLSRIIDLLKSHGGEYLYSELPIIVRFTEARRE